MGLRVLYMIERLLARHRLISCRCCANERLMSTDGFYGQRDLIRCSWCDDGGVVIPAYAPAVRVGVAGNPEDVEWTQEQIDAMRGGSW